MKITVIFSLSVEYCAANIINSFKLSMLANEHDISCTSFMIFAPGVFFPHHALQSFNPQLAVHYSLLMPSADAYIQSHLHCIQGIFHHNIIHDLGQGYTEGENHPVDCLCDFKNILLNIGSVFTIFDFFIFLPTKQSQENTQVSCQFNTSLHALIVYHSDTITTKIN